VKSKASVIVGEPSGFCSGVKRAIAIVKQQASKNNNKVFTLGPIIHNRGVVKELKQLGVKTITDIKKLKKVRPGNSPVVIIRSHGCAPKVIAQIAQLGYRIVDATCPYVKRIQNYAAEFKNNGYRTIVAGDKNHPEVKGILGYAMPEAKVFDIKNWQLAIGNWQFKNIGIVGQTTISAEDYKKAIETLKRNKISETDFQSYQNPHRVKDIKVFNTLCKESLTRQKTCKEIALKVDLMIVIGSKNSANTLTLVDIARKVNHNVYQVENKEDLKNLEFGIWNLEFKKIGVIAGASTPQDTVLDVVREIKKSLLRERYANG
jgi:4-hydroxy-3-methylbut-2-enyl diphosphate reductase